METILSSRTKTVIIGPDNPFVIIGERINPTGRKKLAQEMAAGDLSRVRADAVAQVQAGAQMLDVNAGVPGIDEPAAMRQALQTVMEVVDVPLCVDSANPAALETALSMYSGKALINSTTGEIVAHPLDMEIARLFLGGRGLGARMLWDEVGPDVDPLSPSNVLCIGPAGENLSRVAVIMNDGERALARGGPAAVMGSKNLKTIVVEGKERPDIVDQERFKFLLYETRKLLRASPLTSQALPEFGTVVLMNIINNIGALPTRNHRQTQFEGAEANGRRTRNWLKEAFRVVISTIAFPGET